MAKTIEKLVGERDKKRQIHEAINKILKLEEDEIRNIGEYHKIFTKLEQARFMAGSRGGSILEHLTDDDLLYIIGIFKQSLPLVNRNIERMEGEVASLSELGGQQIAIQSRMSRNSEEISTKEEQLGAPALEEPGFWDFYKADKAPGIFKSLILAIFSSPESIEAAREKCSAYQQDVETRKGLEVGIQLLRSDNEKQQTRFKSNESEINQKAHIPKALDDLKAQKDSMEENVTVLEEQARSFTSTEQREGIKKVIAKEPREDEDLQFNMDI
ncbi:hypothetical protein BN59_01983 [Legionella massiliensis]|uniref:Uncharacterized protein n=1 Tax=Legionella massiliensis TaxID=1034943 RepID=A0A078L0W8_9GAMM|nr:hypothetical protein [Legionella massiliensis]CDZ77693.1 hypothetical protein BN59_01983 [Legionella massiliensis]CEE13431.1 hypothetical protein BN1094_01983 [Legionella massiliensis]